MRNTQKIINLSPCCSFGASVSSLHSRTWYQHGLLVLGVRCQHQRWVCGPCLTTEHALCPLSALAAQQDGMGGKGMSENTGQGPLAAFIFMWYTSCWNAELEEEASLLKLVSHQGWDDSSSCLKGSALLWSKINTRYLCLSRRQIKYEIFQRVCTQVLCAAFT